MSPAIVTSTGPIDFSGARFSARRPFGAAVTRCLIFALALMALAACDTDGEDVQEPPAIPATEQPAPAIDDATLNRVIAPVREQLEAGAYPGAAIALGLGSDDVHLVGLGAIGWTRNAAPVDTRTTMYDLASLTKVVATATAVMLLVDEGRLTLDDPAGRFLPEFREGPKAAVTVRHLLTHTSGVPEGAELAEGSSRAERIARARRFPIYPPVGARVQYSDIGYILLGEIIEAAAGEPMPDYLERRLFGPLGMTSTRFAPGLDCEACAPTGRLRDQSLYRGRAFDPLAQRLDGISGHAGLFSSAYDLSRFVRMLLNGGELEGVRVLSPESAAELLKPQPVGREYRLGWEVICPEPTSPEGEPCDFPDAVRHTGWTGTSIHIDLRTRAWVVLLTNRTYEPRVPNPLAEVRRALFRNLVEVAATHGGR